MVSSVNLTSLMKGWLEVHSLVYREYKYRERIQPFGVRILVVPVCVWGGG